MIRIGGERVREREREGEERGKERERERDREGWGGERFFDCILLFAIITIFSIRCIIPTSPVHGSAVQKDLLM